MATKNETPAAARIMDPTEPGTARLTAALAEKCELHGSTDCKECAEEQRRKEILALAEDTLPLSDGELELDPDAVVSEGGDNGAYVQVWAWVSFAGTTLDKEPEDQDDDEDDGDQPVAT